MRQETINIYTIDELSDKAKEKAHQDWLARNEEHFWAAEWRKSLSEFEKEFYVDVKDYEVSTWRHTYVRIEVILSDKRTWVESTELKGLRLRTFMINNFWDVLFKGKYYSLWSKTEKSERNPTMRKLKIRYSKVMFEPAYPFTGFMGDQSILHPIYEFIAKPEADVSYDQLMQRCVDSWAEDYKADMEDQESLEYFIEHARANEYEFEVDGTTH